MKGLTEGWAKLKREFSELDGTSEDIIQNALKRDKKMENLEEKVRCMVGRIRGLIHLIGVI